MDNDANKEPTTDTSVDSDALNATQSLIARLGDQLDELKKTQKEVNEMVKGVFANDEKLQQAEVQAQEVQQSIKSRRSDLNETAEVKELKAKMVDIKEDMKLVQESLNTHLLNYYQMTNSMVIDLPGGGEREFVLKASLKPKKKS